MRGSRLAFVALLVCSAGCYSFEPMEIGELQPQMQIRARLTRSQAEDLTEDLTEVLPGEDRLIEGTVVEADDDRLLLLVPVARANRGGRIESLNQRLGIPHAGLLEVELKELHRAKTGALSAAGALAIGYLLWKSLLGGSSGDTPGGGPPGPEDSLIPFRIPIGG